MLRGRDGVHQWESPDGLTLAINELDDLSTGAAVYPRFRLVDVDHGYPEGGDRYHKKVGAPGAIVTADYRGSRLHTYTIEVYGRTIDELRTGEQTLRQAFADQSAEGRMDVNLHALHDDYDAGDNRYFNAKPLALTPGTDAPDTDLSPSLGFRREWVLGLRNHAGVYYEELTLATFKQAIVDLGPELYWALDSVSGLTDLSGNGYDGTAYGSPTIGGASALTAITGDSATAFTTNDVIANSGYKPWVAGSEITVVTFASATSGIICSGDNAHGASLEGNPALKVGGDLSLTLASISAAGVDLALPPESQALAVAIDDSGTDPFVYAYVDGVESYASGADFVGSGYHANCGDFSVGAGWRGLISNWYQYLEGTLSHIAVFERLILPREAAAIHEWATTGLRSYW